MPDFFTESLDSRDPELFTAIRSEELGRQRDEIELIASENIVSRAVLEAQGSVDDEQIRRRAIPDGATTAAASIVDVGGEPGHRPRQAAVRLRLRQCAAEFRKSQANQGVMHRAACSRAIRSWA